LIENQVEDEEIINNVISLYIEQLPNDVEALVLGCTHYPIYLKNFQKYFKKDIIDPSQESVEKLVEYFRNHNDIYESI
jgi:glutamate racemase